MRLRGVCGVLGIVAMAGFTGATECDLWSTLADSPDPVEPGAEVTFTVEFGNAGPAYPIAPHLSVELPVGVPGPVLELTDVQLAAIEATISLTLGEAGLYLQSTCENLLVQVDLDDVLGRDSSGTLSHTLEMPESTPLMPVVRVDSPASIAGDLRFGRATCWDCYYMGCFGPRMSTTAPITAEVVMVDDGSAAGNEGCNPSPPGAYVGKIAFVYRGTCEFCYKAFYADQSGALATVIGHNNDPRLGPDDVMNPGCASTISDLNGPVVFVSYNNATRIETALAEGPVVMTLGAMPRATVTTRSEMWENTSEPTDTDVSNDGEWEDTTIAYPQAPVASFTFMPGQPRPGETVQFSDTSSNDPEWWQWDFGDGAGTSIERHPSYSYAEEGSYTVTLTTGNIAGSDSASVEVVVMVPSHRVLIPAAAYAEGTGASFFVTDAEICNAGNEALSVTFEWLPRDADNSEPLESASLSLAPGHQRRFANVLEEVFGLEVGALGALAVVADGEGALVMSRTYNVTASGTFGQSIPGVAEAELIEEGERRRVILMTENDAYRSNLGLANGCDEAVTVMVELHGQSGAVLETRSVDLPPYGNSQLNRLFRDYAPVETGYVDVWSDTEGAAFTCYGSILDWQTSDPTTVLPQ